MLIMPCMLWLEELAPQVIAEKRKIYKGVSANVDFYSGFVYNLLDIPEELYTPIFAMARIVGWSAHRLEELTNVDKIIRPAYRSIGKKKKNITVWRNGNKTAQNMTMKQSKAQKMAFSFYELLGLTVIHFFRIQVMVGQPVKSHFCPWGACFAVVAVGVYGNTAAGRKFPPDFNIFRVHELD